MNMSHRGQYNIGQILVGHQIDTCGSGSRVDYPSMAQGQRVCEYKK